MSFNTQEAEKSLLGSILLDNSVISLVSEYVTPDDFYDEFNGKIYEACLKLSAAGSPIDIATIMYAVKTHKRFQETNGLYIVELTNNLPSAINAVHYAKIIRNDAVRRKLNQFAASIQVMTSEPVTNAAELASNMVRELSEISDSIVEKPYCTLKEAVKEAFVLIEEASKNGGKLPGIMTGFTDLDSFLCGLRPGSLTIIAARPAMGKTAFAVNILSNVCIRNRIPAAMFSLEMTKAELGTRIVSAESKVSSSDLRTANISEAGWNSIFSSFEVMNDAPLYIDDTAGISIETLADRAKRYKKHHNIQLVVVDYLQIVTSNSKRAQTREQEVADVARNLKVLAKDIECPVIALAQLNRLVESRAEKRPILSDLRESGSIEQDADNIMFIHRPGYYDKNEKQDDAEIIIAKQRSGPTGTVHLKWSGRLTQFSDIEQVKEIDHETLSTQSSSQTFGTNPFLQDDLDD